MLKPLRGSAGRWAGLSLAGVAVLTALGVGLYRWIDGVLESDRVRLASALGPTSEPVLKTFEPDLLHLSLILSIGVLILVAVNWLLVVLYVRRSHRLAKLQMDFVAGVSHDLRTPLAVICSAAENLADGVVEPGGRVREYGEMIRKEGMRLGAMVEKILQFSSVKTTKRYSAHPVEVAGVVEAGLADAASAIQSAGFTVEERIDPDLPSGLADEEGLKQCLHNLIGNALKYGGESRWMAVRAMVSTEAKGPEIQITVSDHGPGIEPGELGHIFEPFYRSLRAQSMRAFGSGLGLSMTKRIVEAMGGKISVATAPGKGTSFTLHLRIAWP